MSDTSLIVTFTIIILAGILGTRLAERYQFPKTIILILLGILIGLLANYDSTHTINISLIRDSELLIIELALIVVLFREGMHLNLKSFKTFFAPIIIIAIIGTIANTFLVGVFLVSIFQISAGLIISAFLISAIFTPTDPAATFSVLRGGPTKVKHKIETILGGEAALNDIVAIILVVVILIPAVKTQNSGLEIFLSTEIVINAIWQTIGGILLGIIIGLFSLLLIRWLPSNIEESLISLSSVLIIFSLSVILGTNSAIGALIAGIVIGNPSHFKLKPDIIKEQVNTFWDYIGFTFEFLAFIFVGATFSLSILTEDERIFLFALIVSAIVLLGRIIGIFLVTIPFQFSPKLKDQLSRKERFFIGFSGMKGLTTAVLAAIAFIELGEGDLLGSTIFYTSTLVILITGTFQALLLKNIAKKTDVLETFEVDELDLLNGQKLILRGTIDFLEEEFTNHRLKLSELHRITLPLKEELYSIREQLRLLRSEQKKDQAYLELSLSLNNRAQTVLLQAKENEEINESSYDHLYAELRSQQLEIEKYIEKCKSEEKIEGLEESKTLKGELDLIEEELTVLETQSENRIQEELTKIKGKIKTFHRRFSQN
ncbi:MAG: cation:proton antiporter domain-containing protein [Candidatus Hodarchaeales archaeon]